jgi:hypothetical protein
MTSAMPAALKRLLTGILDYAGMFPPARLPLEQAFACYLRHRQGPQAWMLRRFLCPAQRLADLSPLVEPSSAAGAVAAVSPAAPLPLGVLGQPIASAEAVSVELLPDLEALADFSQRHAGPVVVEAFEVRLPADVPRSPELGGPILQHMGNLIRSHGFAAVEPYYELPRPADVDWVVAALPNVRLYGRTNRRQRWPREGLKLRCGGLEPAAFPTPEDIARVLVACRDAQVPLKFTAGLHHPLRRYSDEVGSWRHGFINLFVAGVLAHARSLAVEQVQRIIEDDQPEHFRFDDVSLGWKELRASVEEIETVRRRAVTTFGSCSFEEPCDDLGALGWLA